VNLNNKRFCIHVSYCVPLASRHINYRGLAVKDELKAMHSAAIKGAGVACTVPKISMRSGILKFMN
jgi:hypothetical protein